LSGPNGGLTLDIAVFNPNFSVIDFIFADGLGQVQLFPHGFRDLICIIIDLSRDDSSRFEDI